MQTECSAERSAFGQVEGRSVVAELDGGALTSDAGGLLLGAADRRPGPGSTDCGMFTRRESRGSSSTQSPRSSGSAFSALCSATRI